MVDQRIAEADPQLRIVRDSVSTAFCRMPDRILALAVSGERLRHRQPGLLARESCRRRHGGPGTAERHRGLSARRRARRQAQAVPARHSRPRRSAKRPRDAVSIAPRTPQQPQARPSATAISRDEDQPSPSCAPLSRDSMPDQPRADEQKRQRRKPQRPGSWLGRRPVADPAAVTLRSARRGLAPGFSPAAIRRRTRSRMSPASSASESAIDWPWQTRQRISSISACACASCFGSGSWRFDQ